MGCWRGLGWDAVLHIAQQMPLPFTVSCSSKSRLVLPFLVLPFWYLLTRVVPDKFQRSSKTVVCVCVCVYTLHFCITRFEGKILLDRLEKWGSVPPTPKGGWSRPIPSSLKLHLWGHMSISDNCNANHNLEGLTLTLSTNRKPNPDHRSSAHQDQQTGISLVLDHHSKLHTV